MKTSRFSCLLVLISILFSTNYSYADDSSGQRWILVTGEGVVEAPPDLAVFRLGVQTNAKSPQLATQANNKAVEKILSVLMKKGIGERDMETANFRLSPKREYVKNKPPVVIGYQVSNTLVIQVRELERVGEYMQLAIEAGGNNFESLSFQVEDSKQYLEKARVIAVKNAQSKAKMMTDPLKVRVGPPLTISELTNQSRPMQARRMMEASADVTMSDVPVRAPNELSVSARVQVKFSLIE